MCHEKNVSAAGRRLGRHRGRNAACARPPDRPRWPKNPRALAGRLRRAQTFLRALGIDIAFSREGRAGSRIIRIRATQENIVSTVSSACDQPAARPAGDVCDDDSRYDLFGRYPIGPACVTNRWRCWRCWRKCRPFISVNRSERLPTSAGGRLRQPGLTVQSCPSRSWKEHGSVLRQPPEKLCEGIRSPSHIPISMIWVPYEDHAQHRRYRHGRA